jgi:hypothetical protein
LKTAITWSKFHGKNKNYEERVSLSSGNSIYRYYKIEIHL